MWQFFPGKLKSLVTFLRNLVQFFLKFWRKNQNLAEKISTVVKTRLRASVETFCGNTCSPEKNPMNYSVQIFSGIYVFLSFFGMIIEKASLCPNECFEGRSFFLEKKGFWVFFSSWAENCHTLAMNLQPIVKNAFFLSRGTFSRRLILFWKKT